MPNIDPDVALPTTSAQAPSASFAATVVAVPTFRRPVLLAALLDALLSDVTKVSATLIVADNDCDPKVRTIVEDFAARWPATHYVPVPDRGLAQVRNTIVAAATEAVPDWRWTVMVDDDGLIEPGWLSTLLSHGVACAAHVVAGPVDGMLPESAGIFARNSIFASRHRPETGLVELLYGMQNTAISRRTLDLLREPLFSHQFNFSGGEDYDFFRRLKRAGGVMAWCNEALMYEPTPADRLTRGAIVARYYTTGTYMAAIDARLDGRRATWIGASKGLVASLIRLLVATMRFDRDACTRQILAGAHYLGRIAGLSGRKTARYLAPQPEKRTP